MQKLQVGAKVWAKLPGGPQMLVHEFDIKTKKWECRYFINRVLQTTLFNAEELVFRSPNISDKPHTITIKDMTQDGKTTKLIDHER